MEIVCIDSSRDVYQLIDGLGKILVTGTYDDCTMHICDLIYREDQAAYEYHLHLG